MSLEEDYQKLQQENERLWTLVSDKIPSAIRLQELEYDVKRFREGHDSACQLIAQMHFAAVGYVGAPKRGIVEDIEDIATEVDRLRTVLKQTSESLRTNGFPMYADKLLKQLNK